MLVRCEGGLLDGKVLDKAEPEPTIHQGGMFVVKLHLPYPRRVGEKVIDKLVTYFEDYTLHQTEAGPVYRCDNPHCGVSVGDVLLEQGEGGAYHVYADRAGKLHARPGVATSEEAHA